MFVFLLLEPLLSKIFLTYHLDFFAAAAAALTMSAAFCSVDIVVLTNVFFLPFLDLSNAFCCVYDALLGDDVLGCDWCGKCIILWGCECV